MNKSTKKDYFTTVISVFTGYNKCKHLHLKISSVTYLLV